MITDIILYVMPVLGMGGLFLLKTNKTPKALFYGSQISLGIFLTALAFAGTFPAETAWYIALPAFIGALIVLWIISMILGAIVKLTIVKSQEERKR